MENSAVKIIESINKGLEWIKKNQPEQYNRRFLQLVEERRKLRILAHAEQNNPGIAAFGQSQVGKSYLMNCILQDKDSPFMVDSPEGEHNFVEHINPIGEGKEATGVVTRFSSFNRNKDLYSPEYPIRFRSLNVRDIILIICDAYFNDFDDYTTESEVSLMQLCDDLNEKYSSASSIPYNVLLPDDILDIKLYFIQHINNGQVYSVKTPFFDRLAQIIDKIPVSDYGSVFSVLWNKESALTELFNKCMGILQRLKFSEYLYLPISSVLHNGIKVNTIMSVSCLQLLYSEESEKYTSEVYIGKPGSLQNIGKFTKSELCTVCSEVIIKIKDQFLNSVGRYDTRDVQSQTISSLTSGDVPMSVLKDCDLLDFPGARAREQGKIAKIENSNDEKKETLLYSFLRGKVAYLFNKYNEEKTINILLYCHFNKNNDATKMWQLLNKWVNDYVGDTPAKRAEFIARTGVSPLFHIGTFFNKDLENPDNDTVGKTEAAIKDRWRSRFVDLLLSKCFHKQNVQWVDNWTGTNKPFQNCYMLRDYKFSNGVYEGYKENRRESTMVIDREYYNTMRETFCQINDETHLFENAGLSWDVSASIGNDGSLYIIEQLSRLATKISQARDIQISEDIENSTRICYDILSDFYISTNNEEILKENIRKANYVFRELEFTCQSCPEFFGHLVQSMQISEAESFKELHRTLPTLSALVNDASVDDNTELILKRCDNFNGCTTDDEKMRRLKHAYRFLDNEDVERFLKSKNVNINKLFSHGNVQRKNSTIIANNLMKIWVDKISGVQFMNNISHINKMDEISITYLVACMISSAKSLQLKERIEKDISDYVDILNTSNINEDLIADIIATTISDFVTDFGYRYLTPEEISNSQKVWEKYDLTDFSSVTKGRKESYNEEELTKLFDVILSSANIFTPAYEANYNQWLEYLYVAFIAHTKVPEYDVEANNKLKLILDTLN